MASQSAKPVRLTDFGITREWDELATDLPKHLMGSNFRVTVQQMRLFNVGALGGYGEYRRAMLAHSYIG